MTYTAATGQYLLGAVRARCSWEATRITTSLMQLHVQHESCVLCPPKRAVLRGLQHGADFERVGWVNDVLSQLWPYINSAVSQQFRDLLAPLLRENKPSWIASLKLFRWPLHPFQESLLLSHPPV